MAESRNHVPRRPKKDLKQTALTISHSAIQEVKLHPLLVIKDTELEGMFKKGEFKELDLDQYVNDVVDFIELMPTNMVMQRLTAEAPEDILIAPQWSLNKTHVLNLIENEFKKRGSLQGDKYGVEIS